MENEAQGRRTFIVVLASICFLFLVFLISVIAFRTHDNPAETIVAVMGATTGVLGTLVGYIAGSSGKEKAQQQAASAEQKLAAVVDIGSKAADSQGKSIIQQVADAYPKLFEEYK